MQPHPYFLLVLPCGSCAATSRESLATYSFGSNRSPRLSCMPESSSDLYFALSLSYGVCRAQAGTGEEARQTKATVISFDDQMPVPQSYSHAGMAAGRYIPCWSSCRPVEALRQYLCTRMQGQRPPQPWPSLLSFTRAPMLLTAAATATCHLPPCSRKRKLAELIYGRNNNGDIEAFLLFGCTHGTTIFKRFL